MKFSLTHATLAIALLFAPVEETTASFVPEMFQSNDDGIIEMDIHIGHKSQMDKQNWPAILQTMHERTLALAEKIKSRNLHHKVEGIKAINDAKYIESKLTTFFNIQIFSKVYIGSDRQEFVMTMDSGSSKLWVEDEKCDECRNPVKFHPGQSTTYKKLGRNMLTYGKGAITGNDARDQVCLKPDGDNCMENFKFMTVDHQQKLHGLRSSGLIGLAPQGQASYDQSVQLFVPSLYKAGAIKKNMFSMFIDVKGKSTIQMGGYDTSKYAKSALKWYPLDDLGFWQLNFENTKVGTQPVNISVNKLIADTGTSLLMMPDQDFNAIMEVASKGMTCERLHNSLSGCPCTVEQHQQVPDITFNIHGDEFTIPRDTYFSRDAETGICIAKITHHPADMWIMGMNFFNDYYTVFDYEQNRLGFAKSINSNINDLTFLQWAKGSMKKLAEKMMMI